MLYSKLCVYIFFCVPIELNHFLSLKSYAWIIIYFMMLASGRFSSLILSGHFGCATAVADVRPWRHFIFWCSPSCNLDLDAGKSVFKFHFLCIKYSFMWRWGDKLLLGTTLSFDKLFYGSFMILHSVNHSPNLTCIFRLGSRWKFPP